jgi:drug/metabolite transporter (DMT)-like permease
MTLFSVPLFLFVFFKDAHMSDILSVFTLRNILLLFAASIFGTVGAYLHTYLLGKIDVFFIAAFTKSVPVLATILAPVLIDESITTIDFLALIFVTVAVSILTLSQSRQKVVNFRELFRKNRLLLLLFFTCLSFALFYVIRKAVAVDTSVPTFILFSNSLSVLWNFILLKITKISLNPGRLFFRKISVPALIGILAFTFESYAYVLLPIGIAAIFSNLSIFLNAVLAKYWLHEKGIWPKVAASAVAGIASVIVYVR